MQDKQENLREQLKILRDDYKTARKAVRNYHKEDLKALKLRYKADKQEVKTELKSLAGADPQPNKLSTFLDSSLISLCKPFENIANNIRYKQSDPDGYEADSMIEDVELVVKRFEKRLSKGKELTVRQKDIASKLLMAVATMLTKKLGKKQEKAKDLQARLLKLADNPDGEEAAQAMLSKLDEMLNTI